MPARRRQPGPDDLQRGDFQYHDGSLPFLDEGAISAANAPINKVSLRAFLLYASSRTSLRFYWALVPASGHHLLLSAQGNFTCHSPTPSNEHRHNLLRLNAMTRCLALFPPRWKVSTGSRLRMHNNMRCYWCWKRGSCSPLVIGACTHQRVIAVGGHRTAGGRVDGTENMGQ